MKSASPLLLALWAALVPAAGRPAADWPQIGGPDRNGISPERGLSVSWPVTGPPLLWKVPLGEGYSGISVQGGHAVTLYGQGSHEFAICRDAGRGDVHWIVRLGSKYINDQGNGPRSTPTMDGGLVYVLGGQGGLYALEVESGEVRWKHDLKRAFGARAPTWGVSTSPLVDGSQLLVEVGGSRGRAYVSFDKLTGRVKWSSQSDPPGYSSPLVATLGGVRQALFFSGKSLVSVSPADGRFLWRYPWRTSYDANIATPLVVAPDRVFISSSYDMGAVLLEVSGASVSEVWKSRVMKNHFHTSVLIGNHLYGFDDGTLKCIDIRNGEELWRQRGFAKGSLIAADGHLIILGERGRLALARIDPARYRETVSFQALTGKCWTAPTLSDGRLYLRNQEEMLCLDLRQ